MVENNNICDCKQCDFRLVVFDNLKNPEINLVCDAKKEYNYTKGQVISRQNDEIKDFYYLKSGLVKIYRNDKHGKEQIISIAKPYEFVSLLSVFSEKQYNYSIAAIEDSTICAIDLNVIIDIIRNNGLFGLRLMERMSKNADKIILTNIMLNKKNLRGRIAYILLMFAEEIYNSMSFDLPLSRKEIAQLIFMTTENVIRILSEFRKHKIIKINGKTIEIIEPERLRQISEHG
ncbi:MAG: fumarate/nitrate reduction transcriptional regulator Fnr [Marinilabiliales bacterium]